MGKNKIKLSFINDGKSFTVPHMTVKAQENLLDDIVKLEKKYKDNEKKYNTEVNKYMMMHVLQTVDNSVTLEDINSMHPDDYIKLFSLIMDGGRELTESVGDKKFRTKETKKTKDK